jgi:hypothetical protein
MDTGQIQATLRKLYREEGHRIVFWYDSEAEFHDILPSLQLDAVQILHIEEKGSLAVKIQLELEKSQDRYLVYSAAAEPAPENDWLLDIKLYSYVFHADRASIILNELGLTSQSLRPYLNKRKIFFRSQDRTNRLQRWISPDDTEDVIDLKMLAVITKVEQPIFFAILMKLFGSFCVESVFDSAT